MNRIDTNTDNEILLKNLEDLLAFFNQNLIEVSNAITSIRQEIKNGNRSIKLELNQLKETYEKGSNQFGSIYFEDNEQLNPLRIKCEEFFDSHLISTSRMISKPDRIKNLFEFNYEEDISTFEKFLGQFKKSLSEKHNSIYQKVSSTITKTIINKTIANNGYKA